MHMPKERACAGREGALPITTVSGRVTEWLGSSIDFLECTEGMAVV